LFIIVPSAIVFNLNELPVTASLPPCKASASDVPPPVVPKWNLADDDAAAKLVALVPVNVKPFEPDLAAVIPSPCNEDESLLLIELVIAPKLATKPEPELINI
jgi:hypothetical protein